MPRLLTPRESFGSSFRNNQPGDRRHGDFGADLNFALKPMFRRELRQERDVFQQTGLSLQAGFG